MNLEVYSIHMEVGGIEVGGGTFLGKPYRYTEGRRLAGVYGRKEAHTWQLKYLHCPSKTKQTSITGSKI